MKKAYYSANSAPLNRPRNKCGEALAVRVMLPPLSGLQGLREIKTRVQGWGGYVLGKILMSIYFWGRAGEKSKN